VPLLALATHEAGQPRLALYNAASGELVRQFTGHADRVYAIAFSADGRLLASASEDQTVCVWSLADLDQVLGRRGRVAGLVVHQGPGGLVVADVPGDSPARGKLRPGDVLAGLVEQGKLRPLASPLAFHEAVFRIEPGRKVTLRRGDPRGADDVTLDVGQGADERKPLLSLFVIRAEPGKPVEEGEWIGWNPVGPYECSSPRAERYLGWHFNTGDPRAPARFALAAAHHKDYYREGVLQQLVRRGTLERVEGPRLPPPTLALLVEEGGRHRSPAEQDPLTVSHPRVSLKLAVQGRPLKSLEALTWKLDDGPEEKLPLDGPDAAPFTVPLELRRGDHQLVVTAWTPEVPPRPTRARLSLRYRPPRPRVQYDVEAGPRFVREPAFDLRALVYPGMAGEDVRVALHHWHDRKDLLADSQTHTIDPEKPLTVARRLELRPGDNLIEVVAVNRNAPRDRQAEETDRRVVEVFYLQKARPPAILLDGVKPPGAGEPVLKVEPLRPVVVHSPAVRLVGKIEASENLLQADWYAGDADRGTRLTGFEPDKAKVVPLREDLTLRPGRQTFRLKTRTASSDAAERVLTIDYLPPTPTVRLEALPGDPVYGEAGTTTVRLRGRVELPRDRHPYRAVVLVNDREAAEAPAIDEAAGTLTAAVAVGAGESRIRVRLSNAWGMVSASEETQVRYLRPPRVLELKQVWAGDKPALNLEARVRSPLPLLPNSVKVAVNRQEAPAARARVGPPADGVQVVRLEDVPLEAGSKENRVLVWVSNAEAECREPGAITVEAADVLPPPVLEFLQPRQNLGVSRPGLAVRYLVRSVSPLASARLVRDGRPPLPLDPSAAVRDAAGQFELAGEQEVELAPGANHLRLEAVNASGRRVSPPLVVTYTPPPFRLVIDGLEPFKPAGPAVPPQRLSRGRIAFPEGVENGHVRLHGHILWGDDRAARAQEDVPVRAFVNGFQQMPVRLRPSAGADRLQTPFEASLLLNWEKHNHVSLVASGQDADDRSEFVVDCRRPVTRQRLHLLVLSPEGQDAGELKAQVLRAVQARAGADGLKTPAFEDVELYGPLVGSQVRAPYVYGQLFNIKTMIDLAPEGAPMSDVVMIYYQGGESVNEQGNFFQTHAGRGPGEARETGIPCDKLVEFLAAMPGAHLLLLDVERGRPAGGGRDKIVRWQDDYPEAQTHVGVLRYAWRGKAAPPVEARLISTMGKAIPRAARLNQVIRLMGEMIAASRNADLVIYKYVPQDLQELLVGGGP
jgi:hypothetical protein